MKIIITGSAGFIGFHLSNNLLKSKENQILGIDSINNYYSTQIKKLRLNYIEVRPVWHPNHLQKPFRKYQTYKINNCQKYIKNLICIPSSANLSNSQTDTIIKKLFKCIK
jgi:nucleoside-diphosphate-sugar epimerase